LYSRIEEWIDGQTNRIKFIPFVCPSQVHASSPTPKDLAGNLTFWRELGRSSNTPTIEISLDSTDRDSIMMT
jgi:hypothetical protein